MGLPLIVDTQHLDRLKVFRPVSGRPLTDTEHLISVPGDLEKLPASILVRIYNQANPGTNINALKPGTAEKFCLPSLIKLADKQPEETKPVAVATPVKDERTEIKVEQPTVKVGAVVKTAAAAKPTKLGPSVSVQYVLGSVPNKFRPGSLRAKAVENALKNEGKIEAQLLPIVLWLVKNNFLATK